MTETWTHTASGHRHRWGSTKRPHRHRQLPAPGQPPPTATPTTTSASPALNLVKLTNVTNNDYPTTPIVPAGSKVTWTYDVTNPYTFPISNVVVTDDAGTPGIPGDDFTATPVLSGGFNVGDTNGDNKLDPGETWQFTASGTAHVGQYNNIATVNGEINRVGCHRPGQRPLLRLLLRGRRRGHDARRTRHGRHRRHGSTTVTPGTVVHDEATVTRTAATPVAVPDPTGSVTFTLFSTGTCTGTG